MKKKSCGKSCVAVADFWGFTDYVWRYVTSLTIKTIRLEWKRQEWRRSLPNNVRCECVWEEIHVYYYHFNKHFDVILNHNHYDKIHFSTPHLLIKYKYTRPEMKQMSPIHVEANSSALILISANLFHWFFLSHFLHLFTHFLRTSTGNAVYTVYTL